MRPLPTSSRMYLETDVPLTKIDVESIEKIKNNLPELPDAKIERIISQYNLSEDLANQLVRRLKADDFEAIVKGINSVNLDPTTVASVLAYDLREIGREGYDISAIDKNKFIDIFTLLADSKISKDALSEIIINVCENPNEDVEKIANDKNLVILDESSVQKIIKEIVLKNASMVEERKMGAMGPLMGMSMKELKGKADGKIINKILKEEIEKLI